MLSLGNVVYCRSLLEPVGGEVGELGSWGLAWRCVRVSFGAKGLGDFLGHACCLLGMLSITAPCWSWWGGEVGEWGECGIGLAVCLYPLGQRGWGKSLGHVCCLWGMLSITAPCWSWWGGEVGKWGECGIGLAVCAWILWDKGAGDGETLGERME